MKLNSLIKLLKFENASSEKRELICLEIIWMCHESKKDFFITISRFKSLLGVVFITIINKHSNLVARISFSFNLDPTSHL